jgi:decaprenylphospho-beta-D-erythro-pentofuranosid-2-ulose 2-reductase
VIDALGSVGSLLLVGGTSDIAAATARRYLRERPLRVVLAARDTPRRTAVAEELAAAGARVEVLDFDADDPASPARMVAEAGGGGDIDVALSSVAGERARASNFVYGSTKAGLDAFFSGLADSLVGTGVSVLVVRPGFVRSKMTAGLADAPLATTPDAVAEAIVTGVRAGRHTVWVPGVLRWVMSGLRHTPRAIFRRLPV